MQIAYFSERRYRWVCEEGVLRPGIFIFFANQGPVGIKDRRRSVELTATEIMPGVRELVKQLDLPDPDRDALAAILAA